MRKKYCTCFNYLFLVLLYSQPIGHIALNGRFCYYESKQTMIYHNKQIFICHPNILHKHCLHFPLGVKNGPKRNWKQCLCKIRLAARSTKAPFSENHYQKLLFFVVLTDFAIKNANTDTLFSVFTNVRTQKWKRKPFNTESLECGKWKKINIQKALPRIRSKQLFICEIFGNTFYPNLLSFVWRRHVCVPCRGTNMAAGNQQKHLFLSFRTYSWILRLRNS